MSALAITSNRKRYRRWSLAAPLVAFMILVAGFPLIYGAILAFQHRTVFQPEPSFAGLSNFQAVLTDPQFADALKFTVVFTVGAVGLEMLFGVALALLLDRGVKGRNWFITVTLLPIMIPASLIGVLWRLTLNPDVGLVPGVAKLFGLTINPLSPASTIATVITVDALHWIPFVTLLVYGALQAVPQDMYEAAAVDGATHWRTVASIVLPVIKPTLVVTLVLRLIDTIKTFDILYVLTGGGPGNRTTNVNIYIYEEAFQSGNFGTAAAASVALLCVLVLAVPYASKRLAGR